MNRIILISVLFILSVSLSAIVVSHIPPSKLKLGEQNELRIEVSQGWEELDTAHLKYRKVGEQNWQTETMQIDIPDTYTLKVSLPVIFQAPLGVEYYFEFITKSGAMETLPIVDPSSKAFILQSVARTGSLSKAFIRLNEDSFVRTEDGYRLVVSFFAIADDIDLSSIALFVNSRDVTRNASIGNYLLVYYDDKPDAGLNPNNAVGFSQSPFCD